MILWKILCRITALFSSLVRAIGQKAKGQKVMNKGLIPKISILQVVLLFRMQIWPVARFFSLTFGWVCCCFAVASTKKWWPKNIQEMFIRRRKTTYKIHTLVDQWAFIDACNKNDRLDVDLSPTSLLLLCKSYLLGCVTFS